MGACGLDAASLARAQLFYILGIDMSGVVVATCMQPAIPVFTAMLVRTPTFETRCLMCHVA